MQRLDKLSDYELVEMMNGCVIEMASRLSKRMDILKEVEKGYVHSQKTVLEIITSAGEVPGEQKSEIDCIFGEASCGECCEGCCE